MNDLKLSALLCARLCHDLISPIGAVNNGVEVMREDASEDMREQALELVSYSASEAVRRLQFFRLAFGSPGGSAASPRLEDARKAAQGLLSTGRVALDWPDNQINPRNPLSKTAVKVLLNLILIATEALARGGTVSVRLKDDGDATQISVAAAGDRAGLPETYVAALAGEIPESGLDSRAVQPYYAARLAESLPGRIDCSTVTADRVDLGLRAPRG